jgi:hypothetical protein
MVVRRQRPGEAALKRVGNGTLKKFNLLLSTMYSYRLFINFWPIFFVHDCDHVALRYIEATCTRRNLFSAHLFGHSVKFDFLKFKASSINRAKVSELTVGDTFLEL